MDLDLVAVLDLVVDLGLDTNPILDPGLAPVFVASSMSLVATVMLVAPVSRVKQFSFPPVLEDAPLNSAYAKVPSISKSSLGLRREAIQLYRISHRELEKRLSIACSVYFEDKGGGLRIEVRDVG
jgi:hypothetical protein